MPVTLEQLLGTPKELEIELNDGPKIKVTYYPQHLTTEYIHKVEAFDSDPAKALSDLPYLILSLLKSWDIKVPLTVEGLSKVPVNVLTEIFTEVMKDSRPEARSGENSGDSSSTTVSSAVVTKSTRSSKRRGT